MSAAGALFGRKGQLGWVLTAIFMAGAPKKEAPKKEKVISAKGDEAEELVSLASLASFQSTYSFVDLCRYSTT
jgi:hypothetical protein